MNPINFLKMCVLFLNTLQPFIGKMAMMTSGGSILVMMPVLMMKIVAVGTCMVTTLTDAAYTASSRHTAFTAPTVTTADGAASAHDHNR